MILYLVIKCISIWRNIFLCSMLHLLYEDIKIYFYHYIIINKKKLLEIIQKEKSNIDFNENILKRTLF